MANVSPFPPKPKTVNSLPLTALVLEAVNSRPGVTVEQLKEILPKNYSDGTLNATLSKAVKQGWLKRYRSSTDSRVARFYNAPIDDIPLEYRPAKYAVAFPPLKWSLWPVGGYSRKSKVIKDFADLKPLKQALEARAPETMGYVATTTKPRVDPPGAPRKLPDEAPKPPVRIVVQAGEKTVVMSIAEARAMFNHLQQLFGGEV